MARISTAQREQRRLHILEVARNLLEDVSYQDVTLDLLAGKIGMTKSNLYHYFGSKEELYQDIFIEHLDIVSSSIEADLINLSGSDDVEAVADVLVNNLTKNPCMHELGVLVNTTLTRNLSPEDVCKFQENFRNGALKLTKSLLMALPSLNVFQVERFIEHFIALKNGLWAEYNGSEVYQEIVKDALKHVSQKDFLSQIKDGLLLLLKGLYAENNSL